MILTLDEGISDDITSTCALFAIMIPLTLGLRGLQNPLSHEITAGREIPVRALPVAAGTIASTPASSNSSPMMLLALAHPKRSATPGPVEPAPVSAADLPQYTMLIPKS